MKKIIYLVLLLVFAACNNSLVDEAVLENENVSEALEDEEVATESVPIEDVIPIMKTMTKADYDAMISTNNPDSNYMITRTTNNSKTRASDYSIYEVKYNWIEDLTYITLKGVTDYQPIVDKQAVTVDETIASRWGIDVGHYYVYSWKLTLVYNQSRAHDFVIGDYAGIKPSDTSSYGYDIEQTGSKQWTVSTLYFRYECRKSSSSDVIKYVYCFPSYTNNDPGSFFQDFKWQYTLEGDYTSN